MNINSLYTKTCNWAFMYYKDNIFIYINLMIESLMFYGGIAFLLRA